MNVEQRHAPYIGLGAANEAEFHPTEQVLPFRTLEFHISDQEIEYAKIAAVVTVTAIAAGAIILARHLHERITNNHQAEVEIFPKTPVTLEKS